MKHSARFTLIALSLAAPVLFAAPPTAKKKRAESTLIKLETHTPEHFLPSSNNGFILIALSDCSLLVNDQPTILRTGESRQERGERTLDIVDTSALPAVLVLVKIDRASQELTISQDELDTHQMLEDASDRKDTLVIALAPIALRDVRDLSDEDEPWRSSPPKTVSLRTGQTAWLAPGMHRLVNIGSTKARFVTIEW